MKRVEALKSSALWRSLDILSSKDRKKLSAIVLLQVFFGFLDLIGVALIGLLGLKFLFVIAYCYNVYNQARYSLQQKTMNERNL